MIFVIQLIKRDMIDLDEFDVFVFFLFKEITNIKKKKFHSTLLINSSNLICSI